MKALNVWAKLGVAATAVWLIGFSIATYLNLAASVAEEQHRAKLWCPSGDANCLAANVSHWVSASSPWLAAYAFAEAISVAAIIWTVIFLGFAMLEWGDDQRGPSTTQTVSTQ